MSYTGEISASNLLWLQDKLAKMNKRAAKLAVPAMALTVTLGKVAYAKDPLTGKLRIAERRLEVELQGEQVKLAGWKLLGAIEHLAGGDVLLGAVPEQFRNRGPVCDHCQGARARKLTCILQHEDGRMVQIGRSCVQDFLGCDPQRLLWWAYFEGSLATAQPEEGYVRTLVSVFEFAVACAVAIRLYGWHKAGSESPTSYRAFSLMRRLAGGDCRSDPLREEERPTAEDEQRAAKAINWITSPETEVQSNSYLLNLQAVVKTGVLSSRRCYGLAASLLVAHQTALNPKPAKSAPVAPAAPTSQWVGTEGQRMDFELTCSSLRSVASDFGECTLCLFTDAAGNRFKWFASGAAKFAQGDRVTLRATVKAHDEFNGVKQTQLTRGKLLATVQTTPN